ncbi:MAG: amidohydrolase family protein [Myxococcota bacterium]
MSARDVLIEGGTVVTLDDDRRVFEGDVLLRQGRIAGVGGRGAFQPSPGTRTVDARGSYVMPGFVQPHVHLCQTLFRGLAEDRALLPWLEERIWPLEGAHSEASLRASARLGIGELLLGGTTTCLDMGTVHHSDVLFETARDLGIGYVGGKAMMDAGQGVPQGLLESTDESLAVSVALAGRWHGAEGGRLRYAFAPRFVLSCTERLMREAALAARESGCLLHTHASENPGEVEAVRAALGKDNAVALHELGYTGPDVVLAHGVWLSEAEVELLSRTKTGIAHCPSTNLKLGSGIARIPELLRAGIPVGIAADGAACNNRLSAFSELRLAALLPKLQYGAAALPAADALWLATRGGAKLLGLDGEVGVLAEGARADVIVVDGQAPHLRPRADPYTTLVYAAEAGDVRHVFVEGEWLVRSGDLLRVELGALLDDAERELSLLRARLP